MTEGEPEPERKGRWVPWLSLIVSVITLVTSRQALDHQGDQLNTQQQQLTTQQHQLKTQDEQLAAQKKLIHQDESNFRASGAKLKVSAAEIVVREKATGQTTATYEQGDTIDPRYLSPEYDPMVLATVINEGRTPGALELIGFQIEGEAYFDLSSIAKCRGSGGNLRSCDLPEPIQAGGSFKAYLPMGTFVNLLRCSSSVRKNGLGIIVMWADSQDDYDLQVDAPKGPC